MNEINWEEEYCVWYSARIKAYEKEFEFWFRDLLLNKIPTCNFRDVIRGSKDKLHEEYIKMCKKQDCSDMLEQVTWKNKDRDRYIYFFERLKNDDNSISISTEFEKFYKDHYVEQLALVEDLSYEDQREKMLLFGFFQKGFELGQKEEL